MAKGERLMICQLLDIGCIFINEIAGSIFIAICLFLLAYFVMAARLNWGFESTIAILIPIALIVSLATSGLIFILTIVAIVLGILIGIIIDRFS